MPSLLPSNVEGSPGRKGLVPARGCNQGDCLPFPYPPASGVFQPIKFVVSISGFDSECTCDLVNGDWEVSCLPAGATAGVWFDDLQLPFTRPNTFPPPDCLSATFTGITFRMTTRDTVSERGFPTSVLFLNWAGGIVYGEQFLDVPGAQGSDFPANVLLDLVDFEIPVANGSVCAGDILVKVTAGGL